MTASSLWTVLLGHSYIIDDPSFRGILPDLFWETCKKLIRVSACMMHVVVAYTLSPLFCLAHCIVDWMDTHFNYRVYKVWIRGFVCYQAIWVKIVELGNITGTNVKRWSNGTLMAIYWAIIAVWTGHLMVRLFPFKSCSKPVQIPCAFPILSNSF